MRSVTLWSHNKVASSSRSPASSSWMLILQCTQSSQKHKNKNKAQPLHHLYTAYCTSQVLKGLCINFKNNNSLLMAEHYVFSKASSTRRSRMPEPHVRGVLVIANDELISGHRCVVGNHTCICGYCCSWILGEGSSHVYCRLGRSHKYLFYKCQCDSCSTS